MRKKRRKKKAKGFTMIELLAIMVILGVISAIGITAITRMVEKSKKDYFSQQEEMMIIAAQSYMQENKSELPKYIGQQKKVSLEDLIKTNYIKDKIVDQNKEPCDKTKSYVTVYKSSQTNYKYNGYLYCPSCGKNNTCKTENKKFIPDAKITFSDKNAASANQLVKATAKIEMFGLENHSDKSKRISSYSYQIYSNNELKYSSGIKILNNTTEKTINVDLLSYIPGKIKIIVNVTNEDGLTVTKAKSEDYSDNTKPLCKEYTYDGNYRLQNNTTTCGGTNNPWIGIGSDKVRQVWVKCDDENGIGCKSHEFSKVFKDNDGITDTIQIEDKLGNKRDCDVYVCIDKTTPTITMEVYKATSDGKPEGERIAFNTIGTQRAEKDYDGGTHQVSGWFNKESYPNGVYIKVIASDGTSGIVKQYATDQTTVKVNKSITKTSTTTYGYVVKEEGKRTEKATVTDEAGNSVTVGLKLNIDYTPPTVSIVSITSTDTRFNAQVVNVLIRPKDELSGNGKFCVNRDTVGECLPDKTLNETGDTNYTNYITGFTAYDGSTQSYIAYITDQAGNKAHSPKKSYTIYKVCTVDEDNTAPDEPDPNPYTPPASTWEEGGDGEDNDADYTDDDDEVNDPDGDAGDDDEDDEDDDADDTDDAYSTEEDPSSAAEDDDEDEPDTEMPAGLIVIDANTSGTQDANRGVFTTGHENQPSCYKAGLANHTITQYTIKVSYPRKDKYITTSGGYPYVCPRKVVNSIYKLPNCCGAGNEYIKKTYWSKWTYTYKSTARRTRVEYAIYNSRYDKDVSCSTGLTGDKEVDPVICKKKKVNGKWRYYGETGAKLTKKNGKTAKERFAAQCTCEKTCSKVGNTKYKKGSWGSCNCSKGNCKKKRTKKFYKCVEVKKATCTGRKWKRNSKKDKKEYQKCAQIKYPCRSDCPDCSCHRAGYTCTHSNRSVSSTCRGPLSYNQSVQVQDSGSGSFYKIVSGSQSGRYVYANCMRSSKTCCSASNCKG